MDNNDSIYKAPDSDLLIKEKVPDAFLNGELTIKKLKRTGWLALLYILILMPMFWLGIQSGLELSNNTYTTASNVLLALTTVIFIYLMLVFKTLLHLRFAFHAVDRHISIIIFLSILSAVIEPFLPDDFNPEQAESFALINIAYFMLLIPMGIVNILFGKRLLSITTDFKYLRLFSWTIIISGIFMASIILILLAIPLMFVSSFAMALMFFRAAKELASEETGKK